MGELTGKIVFINSHDYVSDITGETWRGCLASLKHDEGRTSLYTTSERLQGALETFFATKSTVTVSFWDKQPDPSQAESIGTEFGSMEEARGNGPFIVKAIWNRD